MLLGFIFWWPVGLALLFFGMWSKRMGYWGCGRYGAWQGGWQRGNWQGGPRHGRGGRASGAAATASSSRPSSGNRAFDEYRAETLRRLEEEQKEFGTFLDRLRFAKDKAEFDQFMAERRNHPPTPPEQSQPPTAQG